MWKELRQPCEFWHKGKWVKGFIVRDRNTGYVDVEENRNSQTYIKHEATETRMIKDE